MCKCSPSDVVESHGPGIMLSTLARCELGAAMRHMDGMLNSDDQADALGHFLMMLAALRALRMEVS